MHADDILVTAGGQSALSMAFRAIAGPGDPVLVESPTYPGAIAAARAAGLRPVPVPMDADGLRPGLLADAFGMTRARLLYCQPTHHNPTGAVLAPPRRREIIDAARAAGAFVIEDDFARHLGHGTPVPPPLLADDRDGTVIYLTSLTKRSGAEPAHRRPGGPGPRDGTPARRPAGRRLLHQPPAPGDRARTPQLSGLGTACPRPGGGAAGAVRDAGGRRHARAPRLDTRPRPRGRAPPLGPPAARRRRDRGRSARPVSTASPSAPSDRFFATELPAAYLRLSFAGAADRAELIEAVRRLASSGP
ncbi:aminotransferase class I/II-fold pyridoxal phosphate-dependent enzyme [Nonomuraea ferruginea]